MASKQITTMPVDEQMAEDATLLVVQAGTDGQMALMRVSATAAAQMMIAAGLAGSIAYQETEPGHIRQYIRG